MVAALAWRVDEDRGRLEVRDQVVGRPPRVDVDEERPRGPLGLVAGLKCLLLAAAALLPCCRIVNCLAFEAFFFTFF